MTDRDAAALWTDLVTVGLLGTGRRSLAPPSTGSALGALLARAAAQPGASP